MLTIVGKPELKLEQFNSLFSKEFQPLAYIYYDLSDKWGIRADTLLCQMLLETGSCTSWWFLNHNNMAGIGVTGELKNSNDVPESELLAKTWQLRSINAETKFVKGLSFPSKTDGVITHYAHMSAYCFSNEVCNAGNITPRYDLVRNSMKGKLVSTVSDLSGKWAADRLYGTKIERIYVGVRDNK